MAAARALKDEWRGFFGTRQTIPRGALEFMKANGA
jgi:hypothetical protein